MSKFFSFIFLILYLSFHANGQQKSDQLKLDYDLYHFIDYSNGKSIDAIHQFAIDSFIKTEANVPSFGKGDFVAWFKIDFTAPQDDLSAWYIEVAYPTFDTLEFYYQIDGKWKMQKAGDVINFDQRQLAHRNFHFSLSELEAASNQSIYFRVNTRGSVIFPIEIGRIEYFHTKHIKEEITYGIFYGIMLVMLLYNFFLAFSTNTKAYLYYVLIIFGNIATISALNGHAFQYLWSDLPWWNNHIIIIGIGLWILASNLFTRAFLEVKRMSLQLNRVHVVMAVLGGVIVLFGLLLPYENGMLIGNMLLPINCLILLVSGLYFSFKGVKVARLFTLAWVLYLTGVIMYNFASLGIFEINFFTKHILEIGAVVEVVLLSLALGAKYRKLEIERNAAMDETIKVLADNQIIIENQNIKLEKIVQERTEELQHRQKEITSQNDKLIKQSAEVELKNKELRKAQKLIEEQNRKLRKHAITLEEEVASSTMEIRLSNSELAANVQKLEQYAFITAHNLRAPVARLLGLIYLLEIKPEQNMDNETHEIVSKIRNSANELNDVIKDINQILEIRKDSNKDSSLVNLPEVIGKAKHMLRDSIEKYDVELVEDIALEELESNPVFLESIFYNLLSNAIKYRDPERKSIINIKTKVNETREYNEIRITDNGLGIDMEANQDKIFGMYRRFHDHEEGKGLGLYLVKNQVEILGGKIKVESQVGLGTNFTLFFPIKSSRKQTV